MITHQKSFHLLLSLAIPFIAATASGQTNIGINTANPVRNLEMYGSGDQYTRVQTTTSFGAQAVLELMLGSEFGDARDYSVINDGGEFRIMSGNNNFSTDGEAVWTIDAIGETGIGTVLPTSRLHIDGGEEANNTGDGYFMIGSKSAVNIIMDPNEILARNNSNANSITFQSHDGDTEIGNGGGDTYFGGANGNLGIGTSSPSSRLTIEDSDFQLALKNTSGTVNDWYIGASNGSWTTGDNQLLFSPDGTSNAAVLRLQNVTNNDGTVAPVMIRSSPTQILLLDGNEMDAKEEPLYFNHNSNQYTLLNPSGGRVGIGTDEPSTTMQIRTQDDEYALRIQRGATAWDINPLPAFDYLGFVKAGWTLAHVNGASGQWITISDRRLKENIEPLPDVMDKINRLNVYSYSFKHNALHTRQLGLLAQEAEMDFPEIVNNADGKYTMAYAKLSVLILKALQEQQKEIDALEQEIHSILSSTSLQSNSK